jgi:butyrate kinase
MAKLILVINPGSTSTKIAIFNDNKLMQSETLRHEPQKLKTFKHVIDQESYRSKLIGEFLNKNNIKPSALRCVVARGGLLHPILSGTYKINKQMIKDLASAKYGEHASNLGGLIAYKYTTKYGIPSFIVDPVVVDELSDIARVSGTDLFQRKVIFHALNHKAVARRYAKSINKKYESLDLIVCHMGGGVTIG